MTNDVIIKIEGDAKNYQDALTQVQKETEAFERSLAGAAKISAVAFVGLGAAIGVAVKKAARFEAIESQFEVLTGSVKASKKALKGLTDFAAKTPFKFEGIATAGQRLLGFGIEADNLVPRLQEIGDVAAAVGVPIQDIATIFGQVQSAGKLTGERLLQFQERAIPIGPAIAKTLGIAESELKDFVSKGLVDLKTFNKAFASLSKEGGVAFQGLIKASKTTEGVLSTLGDNFDLLVADLGKTFLPVVKAVAIEITELFQFIREHQSFIRFTSVVVGVTAALAGATFAASTLGIALINLRRHAIAAGGGMNILKTGIRGLLGATGIGALLVALGFVVEKFIEMNDEANDLSDKGLKELDAEIKSINERMKKLESAPNPFGKWSKDIKQVNPELDAMKQRLDRLKKARAELVKPVPKPGRKPSSDGTEPGGDSGGGEGQTDKELKAEEKRNSKVAGELAKVFAGASGAASLLASSVGMLANTVLPGIGGAVGSVVELLAQGPAAVEEQINSFLQAIPVLVENIILSVPTLIETLLDGIDTLVVETIEKAVLAAVNLVVKVPEILAEQIPRLIESLSNNVPAVVQRMADEIPAVAQKLAEQAPKFFISAMIGQLPFLISAMAVELQFAAVKFQIELIRNIPNIIKSFVNEFIKQTPQIAREMANSMSAALDGILGTNFAGQGAGADGFLGLGALFGHEGGIVGAQSGLATVGGSGRGDKIPALLEPGEIVVPRGLSTSFREAFGDMKDGVGGTTVESRSTTINITGDVIGTQRFVEDTLIPMVRDAVEFSNADLGTA